MLQTLHRSVINLVLRRLPLHLFDSWENGCKYFLRVLGCCSPPGYNKATDIPVLPSCFFTGQAGAQCTYAWRRRGGGKPQITDKIHSSPGTCPHYPDHNLWSVLCILGASALMKMWVLLQFKECLISSTFPLLQDKVVGFLPDLIT